MGTRGVWGAWGAWRIFSMEITLSVSPVLVRNAHPTNSTICRVLHRAPETTYSLRSDNLHKSRRFLVSSLAQRVRSE